MINKKEHLDEAIDIYKRTNSSELTAKELSLKYNFEYTSSTGRKIRKWMEKLGLTKNNKTEPEDSEIFQKAKTKSVSKSKYYIITSAQNATKIHSSFWKNIVAYANFLNSEIEVIPIRYKNPTSTFQDLPHDWWDSSLREYIIANRHNIH